MLLSFFSCSQIRCRDGDSLKEIDLEDIPFPSLQPKFLFDENAEVQIAGVVCVSARGGSVLSHYLSVCEKDLSAV